jgi:hypothetical protein
MSFHRPLLPPLDLVAHRLGGKVVSSNKVRAPSLDGAGKMGGTPLEVTYDPKYGDGWTACDFYTGEDFRELKDRIRRIVPELGEWEPARNKTASAEDILKRMNERVANAKPDSQTKSKKSTLPPDEHIVEAYDYTELDGTLLYQNVRYWTDHESIDGTWDKTFRTRMPDGKGDWKWSLASLNKRRVLYKWPELIKYPDATVFVCEGEKDADRITPLQCCAVTVCGDTHWAQDCVQALAGRDIFILQDNDTKGKKRARDAAKALHGTAKTIRVVLLPDLPEAGDVCDWLDAGNSVDELYRICLATDLWKPDETADAASDEWETPQGEEDEFPNADKPPRFLFETIADLRSGQEEQYLIELFVPERSTGPFWGK